MKVYDPITFKYGVMQIDDQTHTKSQPYRVVEKGRDYVILRCDDPMDKGRDIRIRFVDGNKGYWIDTGPLGFGLKEKFDKVQN